jgi:hypothetical protein
MGITARLRFFESAGGGLFSLRIWITHTGLLCYPYNMGACTQIAKMV